MRKPTEFLTRTPSWRRLVAPLIVALLPSMWSSVAEVQAAMIVAPNAQTSVEGNSHTNAPFGHYPNTAGRLQQVFAASQFSALTGPEYIVQMAFRPDSSEGKAFSLTTTDIDVYLSTTAVAPDSLVVDFDLNVGANETLVHRGPLSLSSAFAGPAAGPKDFDIILNLQTPFLYDPRAGNLLFDIRYPNGVGGDHWLVVLDSQNVSGDSVSMVIGDSEVFNGPAITTNGLVARFTTQAVPEPSSIVAWCVLAMFGARRRLEKISPT